MSENLKQPNFIDQVGKSAVYVFFGLLFIAVIVIPIYYTLSKTGVLEEGVEVLDKDKTRPEELINVIKSQQIFHIKESFGVEEEQNFTTEDLAAFKSSNLLQEIKDKLKSDFYFNEIVTSAKTLPPKDFDLLILNARKTRRATWAELGKVSSKGQTTAGKEAEMMIANSITDLFIQMSRTQ